MTQWCLDGSGPLTDSSVMSQVLHGGENLLDKVEELKQRSAQTKTQLELAARQQEEHRRRLEQLQHEKLDISAQYSNLEVCTVLACRWWRHCVLHCQS